MSELLRFGFDDNIINYISFVSSLPDKDFAKYALESKLCIQDRQLIELEKNFLKEPEMYRQQLFNRYISDIKKANSELAMELVKVPDFRTIDLRDVEAVEDILDLADDEKLFNTTFTKLLDEGIKDKRKYSSGLEALTWLVYDYDNEKLSMKRWEKFAVDFIYYAWSHTSESDNFESDRWKNFSEVVKRLNSPKLLMDYLENNYKYTLQGDKSAQQFFRSKRGACYDHATFAGYCLKINGYDNTWAATLTFKRPVMGVHGHVTCVTQDPKDSLYYVIESLGNRMLGPYESIEDAVKGSLANGEYLVSEVIGLDRYALNDEIDFETGRYKNQAWEAF